MILQPLSQVLIFAFVLSAIMSARLPEVTSKYGYSIYLMAGILSWSLFVEILTRCMTLFVENANLLKKLSFPKITLPFIVLGSSIFNNFLLFLAILLIFGVLGHWPNLSLLWLPVLVLINVLLAFGCGLIIGVLNVFMPDIGQIVPIVLQLLFWITPIVYMVNILPPRYHRFLLINPLVPIVDGYHNILLFNKAPDWSTLVFPVLLSLPLLGFGLLLFRKANKEMVDLL